MHMRNNDRPYFSTADAISFWLETPTGVAVRLEADDSLTVIAPFGMGDLMGMRAAPSRAGRFRSQDYIRRMTEKDWPGTWPQVVIEWPHAELTG